MARMARKAPTTGKPKKMSAKEREQKIKLMGGRAWLATRRLNSMLPMLEKYARSVFKDPNIKVRSTNLSTYTDGKTIYIQPPMRLGDDTPHNIGNCGVRDVNLRLTCEACDIDEMVMAHVYHEIAHLVFGSYVAPQHGGTSVFMKLVNEWHPIGACDHAADLVEKISNAQFYIEMANAFDPRLGIALNAQEDTRVNERMFEERPGTRIMLEANLHDIFAKGIERADGTIAHWREAPIDFQVSIGMNLLASDCTQYLNDLHPDAQEILRDPELVRLANDMTQCDSAHELVGLSADVWRRFQDLGVMLKEKCVPPPAEDDEQDEGVSPDQEEPVAEEDAGDAPDIGSLGNEGQPSPSDGEGEGGSDGNDGEGEGSDDGSGAGKDGESDADGSEATGGDASDSPSSDEGKDQGEGDASGMSGLPSSSEGAASSGSGDSDSGAAGTDDDGDTGDASVTGDGAQQSDPVEDVGPGSDDGDDGDAGGSGDDTDGTEGSREGEVAGGDDSEDSQEVDASSGGSGEDAEQSDTESEGGSPGTAGGVVGEGAGDGEEEGGAGEGEEEAEYVEPADWTTATAEELIEVMKAASIHAILGEEADDDFAVGTSMLNQEPVDARDIELWAELIAIALSQSAYFAGPHEDVGKVEIIKYGDENTCRFTSRTASDWRDMAPPLSIVGPVTTAGRVAFSPNRKSGFEVNLKSGKINARSLARKVPAGKDDMFRHRKVQAKRSYHVIITIDVSGSTRSLAPSEAHPGSSTLQVMVRSVMAQAEALHSLGISFEIWAHTAGYHLTSAEERAFMEARDNDDFEYPKINLWMIQVKKPEERWTDEVRTKLTALRPIAGNIDGHTLQFLRVRAEEMKRKFTDVPICYYTDGAMAASNADEEADVMRAETALCKRKSIPLLAVAMGTDSPKQWGFDTVVIESDADLPKVMKQLERHLF